MASVDGVPCPEWDKQRFLLMTSAATEVSLNLQIRGVSYIAEHGQHLLVNGGALGSMCTSRCHAHRMSSLALPSTFHKYEVVAEFGAARLLGHLPHIELEGRFRKVSHDILPACTAWA